MSESKVPASIRVEVPEEYGSAYTNEDESRQWVDRRQRIGRRLRKKLQVLSGFFTEDKAFKEGCKVLGSIFTDWNLCSDEGPLPKPWGTPQAFEALLDSDEDVALWVLGLIFIPVAELIQPEKN